MISYWNRFPGGNRRGLGNPVFVFVALALSLSLMVATADFDLKHWRHSKVIEMPANPSPERLLEVPLDREVYAQAAKGQVDLRIINSDELEVPYQLVVGRGKKERQPIEASVRDLQEVPGRYSSFVAEVQLSGALHNEIEILTNSKNFQKSVAVEGSNDGNNWAVLEEGTEIFDFTLEDRNFNARNTRVPYPVSTASYLRVTIANGGEAPLNIQGASVFSVQEIPNQEETYSSIVASRSEDDVQQTNSLVIDLGTEGIPTSRLTVQIPQVNFYRSVSVEGSEDAQEWRTLQNAGSLYSYDTPRFVGSELSVSYPETTLRYLRLTVRNEDNPPLIIDGVTVYGLSRKLLFIVEPGASYQLYYGNAEANAPSYDLERLLPYLETEVLPVGVLGPQTENPAFTIPELPVTERIPWLIPVAVAVVAVMLGLLLLGVFRHARRMLPPPG